MITALLLMVAMFSLGLWLLFGITLQEADAELEMEMEMDNEETDRWINSGRS